MFTKDQIKSVKKLEFNSNHYGYTLTIDSKVFIESVESTESINSEDSIDWVDSIDL